MIQATARYINQTGRDNNRICDLWFTNGHEATELHSNNKDDRTVTQRNRRHINEWAERNCHRLRDGHTVRKTV